MRDKQRNRDHCQKSDERRDKYSENNVWQTIETVFDWLDTDLIPSQKDQISVGDSEDLKVGSLENRGVERMKTAFVCEKDPSLGWIEGEGRNVIVKNCSRIFDRVEKRVILQREVFVWGDSQIVVSGRT